MLQAQQLLARLVRKTTELAPRMSSIVVTFRTPTPSSGLDFIVEIPNTSLAFSCLTEPKLVMACYL